MTVLRVLWRDAYFELDGGRDDARADYLVCTVGHVVDDGATFLALAAEQLPDGTFRAITYIPLECVLERAPLDVGDTEDL